MRIFCDDGSTATKTTFFAADGSLKTTICEYSFRSGWKVDGFGSSAPFNYTVDGQKFTFDPVSAEAISTTNIEYQYSNENLLAVHHALLQTGIPPQAVTLWVTLPVSEYYTPDSQKNTANIERKRQNLMRPISVNKGTAFTFSSIHVLPESLPSVFNQLLTDNVGELETSLVVDLGGTTLDCGAIVGQYDSVSKVSGEPGIGVAQVTQAVLNILKQAGSETSPLVANRLIRERSDDNLLRQVVNDATKIPLLKSTMTAAINSLAEQVIGSIQKQYKGFNRIYLTGGGASLIAPAIKAAWPNLGEKIRVLDSSQTALVEAIAHMNQEGK